MGQSEILEFSGEARRTFMRALLHDLRALELMLDRGLFEEGVTRIGAEQELFLVDRAVHPALASLAVLERLKDPHFTTELGAFQLEINLDPLTLTGDCLSKLRAGSCPALCCPPVVSLEVLPSEGAAAPPTLSDFGPTLPPAS